MSSYSTPGERPSTSGSNPRYVRELPPLRSPENEGCLHSHRCPTCMRSSMPTRSKSGKTPKRACSGKQKEIPQNLCSSSGSRTCICGGIGLCVGGVENLLSFRDNARAGDPADKSAEWSIFCPKACQRFPYPSSTSAS